MDDQLGCNHWLIKTAIHNLNSNKDDNHDSDDDFVHQGHGHIQFSLVPSTVAAGLTVDVFLNTDCIPSNTIDVFLITESSKPPQTGLNKYNHFEDLYSQEIGPSLHLSLYCLMCIIA